MTAAGSNVSERNERLYERLAELLDSGAHTLTAAEITTLVDEPDVAAEIQAYFAAAHDIREFAGRATQNEASCRSLHMPPRVGDYELLGEIGRGGAAVVYQARQVGLNRLVAIKMLHGGQSGSLHDVERLRFEAEAVARLHHVGIVPIHVVGEHDGRPYFSMPLYDGGNLSGRLQEFVAQPRRAAELVESIAQAVQHAHERGILHRDLKPSNILLDTNSRPHVADFGLAKRLAAESELTRTGELIGTPAYMAPERVAGSTWAGPDTIATDVYGLGAILYVLLTGRPPFEKGTPVETLLAVGTTDIVAPGSLNPAVDRDLETICLKCLEKNPTSRYPTAADVAGDLRRWLAGEPITARHTTGMQRARQWFRRHPVRAMAALAAALLILLGGTGLTTGYLVVSNAYQEAEVHATRLNQQLYVSQMSLAHRHVRRGELPEARRHLDQFRDQAELQGFEWQWLDRQARMMPREVASFSQHTHIIYGGDLSPDGRTAATCGADGTFRLWDTATGAERRVLENGAGLSPAGVPFDENTVDFSPDGTMLASAGEDGGVRLWNLVDGREEALTPTWPAEARCSFSPDGRLLAACWTDGHLHVWDVATRALRLNVSASSFSVLAACFTPSGTEVVTADGVGIVAVWDVLTGNQRLKFKSDISPRALAVAPNGYYVAVGGTDESVRLHRLTDGLHDLSYYSSRGVRSLVYSPDGKRLAAAGNDGCVWIWDTATRSQTRMFKAHPTAVWNISFAPGGSRLLTVSSDRTAVVWDVTDANIMSDEHHRVEALRALTCSPDGRRLAYMTDQGIVRVRDVASFDELASPPVLGAWDVSPIFLRSGQSLVFVDQQRAIRFWNLETHDFDLLDPSKDGSHVGLQPTSKLATLGSRDFIAKSSTGPLFVCDGAAWNTLTVSGESVPRQLLGTLADGKTLVLRRENPAQIEFCTIIDHRAELHTIHSIRASAFAASANGEWLALGVENGTIELVDAATMDSRRTLVGHYEWITSLDFSSDGRTLVSTSMDGTARLWNVAIGSELFTIVDGEQPLYSAKFLPDGRTLAVGGDPEPNRASLLLFRAK